MSKLKVNIHVIVFSIWKKNLQVRMEGIHHYRINHKCQGKAKIPEARRIQKMGGEVEWKMQELITSYKWVDCQLPKNPTKITQKSGNGEQGAYHGNRAHDFGISHVAFCSESHFKKLVRCWRSHSSLKFACFHLLLLPSDRRAESWAMHHMLIIPALERLGKEDW